MPRQHGFFYCPEQKTVALVVVEIAFDVGVVAVEIGAGLGVEEGGCGGEEQGEEEGAEEGCSSQSGGFCGVI